MTEISPVLWVRADGSYDIGLGHVMRTMAIAEMARDAGIAVRYVAVDCEPVRDVLAAHGFPLTSIAEPADERWLSGVTPSDIVVFDGYHLPRRLLVATSDSGALTCVVDDRGWGDLPVDVVVDPDTEGASAYVVLDQTRMLLGLRYALVRSEFRQRRRSRGSEAPGELIVTLGGSDVMTMSHRVLEALTSSGAGFRPTLVVGPAAASFENGATGVRVVRAPSDLAAIFDTATAAVTAAGNTAVELLAMGVPAIVVPVVSGQRRIAERLGAAGAALVVAPEDLDEELPVALARLLDPSVRTSLSEAALALVDGDGARRVLDALVGSRQWP